ncbi:zinc finger protein 154-like [Mercenaria mercenaria]|uniref:zinc finger protein 154-like n=1 Tax=Mercenaria mercenaria TaxID=6596 RepID=UPI00234F9175|nr:zinc finger protein 154-like [Mercenaria mercenaria]
MMDSTYSCNKEQLCQTCGKEFKSRSSLNDHVRRHEERAPYMCCGKNFYSTANMTRHRCSAHKEKKEHQCSVCGAVFSTNSDVRRHSNVHSIENRSIPVWNVDLKPGASNGTPTTLLHTRAKRITSVRVEKYIDSALACIGIRKLVTSSE